MAHVVLKGGRFNTKAVYIGTLCNMCVHYPNFTKTTATVGCKRSLSAYGGVGLLVTHNPDKTSAPWGVACEAYKMAEDVPQLIKAIEVLALSNRNFIVQDK